MIYIVYYEDYGKQFVEAYKSLESVMNRIDEMAGTGYKNIFMTGVEVRE